MWIMDNRSSCWNLIASYQKKFHLSITLFFLKWSFFNAIPCNRWCFIVADNVPFSCFHVDNLFVLIMKSMSRWFNWTWLTLKFKIFSSQLTNCDVLETALKRRWRYDSICFVVMKLTIFNWANFCSFFFFMFFSMFYCRVRIYNEKY